MGKYDKYICTTLHKRHMLPGPTPEQRDQLAAEGLRISMEHVLWIDSDIIPRGLLWRIDLDLAPILRRPD